MCKCVSPCLARSKRILLRAFSIESQFKVAGQAIGKKADQRKRERGEGEQREGDSKLKPEFKKAFYSRDRWTLSR